MTSTSVYGIIMSGGESSRMGSHKALLKLNGRNFADILIDKLRKSGLGRVYIVLGADHAAIAENIDSSDTDILVNHNWQKGQLSSLQTAVRAVYGSAEAVMIFLIDQPQVDIFTIDKMIDEFNGGEYDIVVPVFSGRGGHPVIFGKTVFDALLKTPDAGGAREVVRSGRFKVKRLEVEDRFVLQDIDTVDEYRKIKQAG